MWNRILRLSAVGRNLFFPAALGLVLCYWIIVSDAFGWQKGSGVLSSAQYGLLSCWSIGIVVLALLDARSRFQDYKRAKDLFFENGFKSRIAKIYIHSKCQRDAARGAAKDLGLLEQLDSFYQSQDISGIILYRILYLKSHGSSFLDGIGEKPCLNLNILRFISSGNSITV